MTEQTALKKPTHALFIIDNWDGEGDKYWIFSYKENSQWIDDETQKPVIAFVGDKILKVVKLEDSQSRKLAEENELLPEGIVEVQNNANEQLQSLFERVSGCEVGEFTAEQAKYLADMIEGQMDANEGCIDNLKSENTALREALRLKEAGCDG